MCRSNGDNQGETEVLNNLGYLAQLVGNHHTALSYYERSLERYRDLGHTYYEADVLDRVGQTYQALRMVSRARAAWSEALELYQDQHRRVDAERVQQLLADLGEPSR
ncbi:tetratricopeptide repeat protein [Nocardia puris]|uniref:Tetratricopeptide repeat protein n=3 Tax=Nocardia puris TaxID=208602 RepID=A0A366CZ10_9NOCA|nr:tetratricopeptide repeat protein [Nocardia puris]